MPLSRPPFRPALRGLALLLGLGAAGGPVPAASPWPVTPAQRGTAEQVAVAGVPLAELAPGAPDEHLVVPGDTLWGLARLFLRSPWRWPELWGLNLEAIRNPHLIYPGQRLRLERRDGRARLRLLGADEPAAEGLPLQRLRPRVRDAGPAGPALSAVPWRSIAAFLNETLIVEDGALLQAPRLVATPEGRLLLGRGDPAYALGPLEGTADWRIFRRAQPLLDPETGELLGHEARFVADARLEQAASLAPDGRTVPARLRLGASREEAQVGDRLLPRPPAESPSYLPHAPDPGLSGRLVRVQGDALTAGAQQIVILNRGRRDGLEHGHVLAVWRAGALARDATVEPAAALRLPDERRGLLFVLRSFERSAYALVLEAEGPLGPGDRFTAP